MIQSNTDRPDADDVTEDDQSGIHTSARSVAPVTELERFRARAVRLDTKLRLGAEKLLGLPPHDPRRRLLRAAITRRDEVLLDGILRQL